MQQHALPDRSGFSLIELMVAILIITVALMALLGSLNIAIQQNSSTKIRGYAITLADQIMTEQRSVPTAQLLQTNGAIVPLRTTTIRNITYNAGIRTWDRGATTRELQVVIQWNDRGSARDHILSTMISLN